MNKFSLKCCEYKILHSLEQSTLQVKDSITLFYKRIETRVNDDLYPMRNRVSAMYGYKSVMIRDDQNKYLMEMYLPIRLIKGQTKIQQMEKRIKLNKIGKDIRRESLQPKCKNKMLNAIFVEDFATDDSMQDIDFEYLMSSSNYSEENQSEENMDEVNMDLGSQSKSKSLVKHQNKKKQKEMMRKLEKYRQDKADESLKRMHTLGANSSKLNRMMYLNATPIELYKSMKKVRQKQSSQVEKSKKVQHGQFLQDTSNKEANKFLLEQKEQGVKKEKKTEK